MWKTPYKVAILTASDKGSQGLRNDESGPLLQNMMQELGCEIADTALLADDKDGLAAQLRLWCDEANIHLILTTGGTGLSPRDLMPEATLSVADRLVPGISEAIRAQSLLITNRAMLSRAVCVTRKNTLILNLPGSPKAARESLQVALPALEHALDLLCSGAGECASG